MNLPLGNPRRSFGSWLRNRRKSTGKSIADIANETGMSIGRVKRIETGYDRISPYRLYDFSLAYGVSFDQMMDEILVLEPRLYEEFRAFERQIVEVLKTDTSYARHLMVNLGL